MAELSRRTILVGLASVAVAPALPAEVYWVDVGPLGIGPALCACADYIAAGYRPAFTAKGGAHVAGCTWSRI